MKLVFEFSQNFFIQRVQSSLKQKEDTTCRKSDIRTLNIVEALTKCLNQNTKLYWKQWSTNK